MGFLDILLGRSKPTRSRREAIFSITTAEVSLQTRFGILPSGRAAVSFKPVEASFFVNMDSEIRELLRISARSTATKYEIKDDGYGYRWVILEDRDFEDLVSIIHLVGETIADNGYEQQLLAAVFGFKEGGKDIYWIYNYKRGRFYPFVPEGQQRRDSATELRLRAVIEKEMPIEPSLERWYALWGIPF
ncbi:MAG: hypothetical protein HY666_03355 [Chloroflexi bacterium]|nr:hypothetical protein [Chloroflexota bacterium]